MRITLDVSAAVEVVMGGSRQNDIIKILNQADWVITPTLYIYESTNVMWKYYEYQSYSQEEIIKKIEYIYQMIDQFIDGKDIFEEALALSCKINHPAYDSMYLVTSRRKNAALLTLDKRLIKAANKVDIPVAIIK